MLGREIHSVVLIASHGGIGCSWRCSLRLWIAILRLKWNWLFGICGLLPGISNRVALTYEPATKTVITFKPPILAQLANQTKLKRKGSAAKPSGYNDEE